jgi:hypothetical protein
VFFSFFPSKLFEASQIYGDFRTPELAKLGMICTPLYPNIRGLDSLATTLTNNEYAIITYHIIYTLYILYINKVYHLDMIFGNVLIRYLGDMPEGEKIAGILIYDWDRSYQKGLPNPILGTNPCFKESENEHGSFLCSQSQCNIFFENGRPVDLIRFLKCFIIIRRTDLVILLLKSCLKINSDEACEKIVNGLNKGNAYFLEKKDDANCSLLFKENLDPEFEEAVKLIGSWEEIAERLDFKTKAIEKGFIIEERNFSRDELNDIKEDLIFIREKRAREHTEDVNRDEDREDIIRENGKITEKKSGNKKGKTNNITESSSSAILQTQNKEESVDTTGKMNFKNKKIEKKLSEIERKPISKWSWSDYSKLKQVAFYFKHGSQLYSK